MPARDRQARYGSGMGMRPNGLPVPVSPTPLVELLPGLLGKMECNNPAGSHKVRAARWIVEQAVTQGHIVPGHTTVIEKTGGNFGFGLAVACHALGVPVELAVGLGFSPIKRRYLELFGARLVGVDMLERGAKPREVVEWRLAHAQELGRNYFFTDQFNNPGSLQAHVRETGPEIAGQLAAQYPQVRHLVFVACAGTGASLMGITAALREAGYTVQVVLVEPDGCDAQANRFVDHPFEGMSVGVPPPFVNWAAVDRVETIDVATACDVQRTVATRSGFFVGPSSAACLAVALKHLYRLQPHTRVLTLMYDSGLWYPPPPAP